MEDLALMLDLVVGTSAVVAHGDTVVFGTKWDLKLLGADGLGTCLICVLLEHLLFEVLGILLGRDFEGDAGVHG